MKPSVPSPNALPGTHATKGSFFTRGTSRDEYARYTEEGEPYVRNVDRLLKKWETAKRYVPGPEFYQNKKKSSNFNSYFTQLDNLILLKELLC